MRVFVAYIEYKIHPNDPEATEAERLGAYGRLFIGLIVFWGSLGALIFFIISFVNVIKDGFTEDFLVSVGVLLLMAVIDFFSFYAGLDKISKRAAAKNYFLFFFGGTVSITAIISIIVALKNGGSVLLMSGIGGLFVTILVVCLVYFKINRIRLFTDKALLDEGIPISRSQAIEATVTIQEKSVYCHKCGKEMSNDSRFCSSCGTPLSEELREAVITAQKRQRMVNE